MTEANQARTGMELRALRHTARRSIIQAASWLGVSTGHLSNAENGFSALSAEQEAALRTFYGERICGILIEVGEVVSEATTNGKGQSKESN